jgi:N-acetylated-alpha-linked acidic dipeptidase
VIEEARRQAMKNLPAEEKKKAEADPALRISPLGSGSDYTSFIDHVAVASLNIAFGGEGDSSGVYHSIYDSYAWYTRFSDTDFVYGKALAQVAGTMLLRLADAAVLPFQFTDYADTLSRYAGEVQKLAADRKDAQPLDFAMLTAALQKLRASGEAYEKAVAAVPGAPAAALAGRRTDLAAANRLIYTSERKLAYEGGLPRRDWFKHVAYAPGFYTGYGVKTLPMIREGIEEGHWDEAKQGLAIVTRSLTALAAQVDQATAAVTKAVGSRTGTRP